MLVHLSPAINYLNFNYWIFSVIKEKMFMCSKLIMQHIKVFSHAPQPRGTSFPQKHTDIYSWLQPRGDDKQAHDENTANWLWKM